MSGVKLADVPAVLAQHGIAPDADAETLMAAFIRLGWRVTIEEGRGGAVRRHTAQATHVRDNPRDHYFPIIRETVRATESTPQEALAFALAKALEKGREA